MSVKTNKPTDHAGIEIRSDKVCRAGETVLRTTAVMRVMRHYHQTRATAEKIVERMMARNILVYEKNIGTTSDIPGYTVEDPKTFFFVEK
jgi:hypothetical protein